MSHHLRLIFAFVIGVSIIVRADDEVPMKAIIDSPDVVIKTREEQLQDLLGRSTKIREQSKDKFIIPNDRTYHPGEKVTFVRVDEDRFQIVARGVIDKVTTKEALVSVDTQTLIKFPLEGDYVVRIGNPWVPPDEPPPAPPAVAIKADPAEIPGYPGYIEYIYGDIFSDIESSGPTPDPGVIVVNQYKQVPRYVFPSVKFTWFLEYAWRVGIEYETFSGIFPTSTYQHLNVQSSENYSRLLVNYRTRLFWNEKFRFTYKFGQTRDNFLTDNNDAGVITSSTSGLAFGGRLTYEIETPTWKTDALAGAQMQGLYVDVMAMPLLGVQDSLVMRGSSASGSTGLDLRIGGDLLFYSRGVPLLKRWVLNFEAGQLLYDIKMQGPVVDSGGDLGTIPTGGHYHETRRFFMARIGLRFDDFISKFFKPR